MRCLNHTVLVKAGLVALLSVSIVACSLSAPPVVIVTATPSAAPSATFTAGPTATPRPTLTPTVPPTPTAPPQTVIDQANTALQDGDYQTAITTFAGLLDPPGTSDPTLKAAAEFGLGVADLREGSFADAITALTRFVQDYPNDPHAPQAFFLRGEGYMGQSEWQPAIDDFQAYMKKRPGLLDSYAWERIGDADLVLGQNAAALSAYSSASQDNMRSLTPLLQIREKAAAAYLNAGDVKDAVALDDSILQVAKVPTYRASIAYAAAQALYNAGDKGAYSRFQAIVSAYPQTPEAYQSMQALLSAGISVDDLQRGQISLAAGDYNDAIQALYDYTSHMQLDAIDPNAFLMLGQAYRGVGSTDAALTSFETLIQQYPTSPLFGQAWLEEGRTLDLAGRQQDAIAKYEALADQHPGVSEGAEALWRAGYLYSTLGDSASSLATFETLGQKYPGTDWAADGLYREAMAAYNAGQTDQAQRLFTLLAVDGTGNLKAAGALWLGRLYQIQKKDDLARQAYVRAAAADPEGYYSDRAADLLAGHGPFVPPSRIDWAFNDPAHVAEAEQWMRTTFKITQPGALWPLAPQLATDPRMLRGNELWSLAEYDAATAEYTGLRDDYATNPLALYQLATYFYQIGLYKPAIDTAQTLLDGAKVSIAQAPRYIAAIEYPIAYYDLVLPAAQKAGVDPLLVFSVIRQESLFQAQATSSASAQGLMQIIPDTGTQVANELNWPDYQDSDLYRPFVNVTFGVTYLKDQLSAFDNNVYAALAAYNAGPDASRQWYRISNGDPDLFLQAIDIDETQTYVRRIYEQYNAYAAIYAAK